jgi:hypothetical protein
VAPEPVASAPPSGVSARSLHAGAITRTGASRPVWLAPLLVAVVALLAGVVLTLLLI